MNLVSSLIWQVMPMSVTELLAASTRSTVPLSVGRILPYQYFGRYEAPTLDPLSLGRHGKTGLQIRRGTGGRLFEPITLDKLVRAGRHRLAVSIRFHVLAEGGGLSVSSPEQGQRLRPGTSMGGHCR